MKKVLKIILGMLGIFGIVILALLAAVNLSRDPTPVASMPSNSKSADDKFIHWIEHRVDDQSLSDGIGLRGADGLQIADLDRDGYQDIVSVHEDSNHIRIAFGTADPNHWISVTLAQGDFIEGVEDPAIGDVNGDGWPDLLVACEGGTIVYFQNPGGQQADIRKPNSWDSVIPSVAKGKGSWIRVFLADLDKDGRLEAVVTNKSIKMYGGFGSMDVPPTPMSWLAIPKNPLDEDEWKENQLGRYKVPVNARPIDLDGDGDLDILGGSRGESRMMIFENEVQKPLQFKEYPVNVTNRSFPKKPTLPKKLSGMVLAFADLNQDARLDIVTFETPWSVVWLEQPESWDQSWKIHHIASAFPDSPTALALVDINGDGRLDLFSGGYSQGPRDHDLVSPGIFHRAGGLFWFEQPEKPTEPWRRHNISRRMRAMFDDFVPLDLNGDDLVDLVGTRGNSGELDGVIWLEQKRSREPHQVFTQAHENDSKQLPAPSGFLRTVSDWLLM